MALLKKSIVIDIIYIYLSSGEPFPPSLPLI